MKPKKLTVQSWLLAAILLIGWNPAAMAADPWGALWDQFQSHNPAPIVKPLATKVKIPSGQKIDPWAELQAIFVPFTPQEEEKAQTNPLVRKKVAAKLNHSLAPHRKLIHEASALFNVPAAVIAAVIMVESGGNPHAAAQTSSAKGLMQTIDTTFAEARQALPAQGINIVNNPFNPRASIMAGTWYLDQMYRQVIHDRGEVLQRNSITSWRLPTEYYYAGPGHGRKRSQVVMIYAGGKQIRVDKSGYSSKVLRWAHILG